MDVESDQGEKNQAADEGDQDNQDKSRREGLEELPHFRDAGAAGVGRARCPVQKAGGQGEAGLFGQLRRTHRGGSRVVVGVGFFCWVFFFLLAFLSPLKDPAADFSNEMIHATLR